MRHFYIRFVLCIVFIVAGIVNFLISNMAFAVLYGGVGIAFLCSVYSIWKKEKNKRR